MTSKIVVLPLKVGNQTPINSSNPGLQKARGESLTANRNEVSGEKPRSCA